MHGITNTLKCQLQTSRLLHYKPKPKGDPFGGYAKTTLMKKLMEWEPKIELRDGVKRYHNWVSHNKNIIPQWL